MTPAEECAGEAVAMVEVAGEAVWRPLVTASQLRRGRGELVL